MIDDNLYEGMEYFTVYIDSLPHGIVRANPHVVKVMITDDECKYTYGIYIICMYAQKYYIYLHVIPNVN